MKLETRLNLIFLAVFLALSLPGAVILFKRKLDPAAAPMYLPDPVRKRLPYMAPQWTPDEVTRVIPAMTGQWVEELNRQQAGGAQVLLHDHLPVLSDDRMIQVTALKSTPGSLVIDAIAWDDYGAESDHYDTSITIAGNTIVGRVRSARKIQMPQAVRKELLNSGYVNPRPWIEWLELEFSAPAPPNPPFTLKISYKEKDTLSTSVNLFTQ